jgi:hypothetical protein
MARFAQALVMFDRFISTHAGFSALGPKAWVIGCLGPDISGDITSTVQGFAALVGGSRWHVPFLGHGFAEV